MSQGNSLYSYLKETKMSFFLTKNGGQKGRTVPAWRVGTSGKGEVVVRGCRRVNMVLILCTQKWKNETC
jgi:hypothetical protein